MIRALNGIARGPNYSIQVLIGKHQLRNTQLYYIDDKGNENNINGYIAIGSGKGEADLICKNLVIFQGLHTYITIKRGMKTLHQRT